MLLFILQPSIARWRPFGEGVAKVNKPPSCFHRTCEFPNKSTRMRTEAFWTRLDTRSPLQLFSQFTASRFSQPFTSNFLRGRPMRDNREIAPSDVLRIAM